MKSKSVSILYFVDVDSGVYADVTNSVVCVCVVLGMDFFFCFRNMALTCLRPDRVTNSFILATS